MKKIILIIVCLIILCINPTYTKRAKLPNGDEVDVSHVPNHFKKGDSIPMHKVFDDSYIYLDTASIKGIII